MPEQSHSGARSPAPGSTFFPEKDFLASPSTEVIEIADSQVDELTALHAFDPDQVPADAVKKRLGWLFWLAAGWFLLIVALALAAPLLERAGILPDPTKAVKCPSPPCSKLGIMEQGYLLGTDNLSRDLFSRIVWGARVSLLVGFSSIFFGLLLGGTIGVIAGFFKGKIETVLMAMTDMFLAFPAILLALAIITFASTSNPGEQPRLSRQVAVILALTIVSIPPIARLVRASSLVFAQREFVLAARTLGASNLRIMVKEIVPNVLPPIFAFGIIGVAIAITAEGALAFLGLSLQPPNPTWGGMINDGQKFYLDAPHMVLVPCGVLFLTVLSLNLAGDRLREYFDIKESVL